MINDYMQADDQGEPAIGELVGWDQVDNVVDRLPEADRYTGPRFPGIGQDNPESSDHCPVTP